MTNLTKLILDFEANEIDVDDISVFANLTSYFGELNKVELNLKDNYIDNAAFVELLNLIDSEDAVVFDIRENNIV